MNIPPNCLPGQIVLRNDTTGEWECVWPPRSMTHEEKWFLGVVTFISVSLLSISVAMLVVYA